MRMLIPAVVCGLFISACGSGPGSLPSARPDAVISGVVFDGPVMDATVWVYGFASGAPGTLLGTTHTDAQGQYALTVSAPDQPVLVQVSGGTTVDPVTGTTLPLPAGAMLTALANYRSGVPMTIAVTAFTHLAAGLAEHDIGSDGMAVAAAIDNANAVVSQLLGVDVIRTLPVDFTNPANAAATLTPQLQYAFAVAALSGWADAAAIHDQAQPDQPPYDAMTLAQDMHDDIAADGVLDGYAIGPDGNSVALSLGSTALNEDVYRHEFAVQMIRVAQGAENRSSVGPVALAAAAQAYNDSVSPVFGSRPVIPFSEGGPAITLKGPVGWVGGPAAQSPQLVLELKDAFGFSAPPAITLDGMPLALTAATQPPVSGGGYTFTAQIDAASLADGRHSLGVLVSDDIGAVASASFPLDVDHTPPQFCVNNYWSNSSGFYPLPQGSANWSGDYRDNLSGVVSLTIDGHTPVLTPGTGDAGTWVLPDSSALVLPDFDVTVTDAAGNVDHFISIQGSSPFAGPACVTGWH